jgi:murein DD-endopeptidase MepM/ murein hydrolase activator NlpD
VVKQAEDLGGWGKIVILEHNEGISIRYAHLDQFEVKAGDKAAKGQVIGRVGNTGQSTGPHLHDEVRKDGNPFNPAKFY